MFRSLSPPSLFINSLACFVHLSPHHKFVVPVTSFFHEPGIFKDLKKNYPRVGVGDGHLYNTTSSQCSVMTEDYCAVLLRSSNCAVWLKMTRHFGARARNYILKINADVYISGFETFAPSAENV